MPRDCRVLSARRAGDGRVVSDLEGTAVGNQVKVERGRQKAETETCRETGKRLVCFALKEEADPFRKFAADRPDVHTLISGIGRKNAESTVSAFLESCRPQFVLTCGFTGGLNPQLALGDVVFASDDDGLSEKLMRTGARPVKFACSSRIAVTVGEKNQLRRTTGADAVE